MQIFADCGGPLGTQTLVVQPTDTFDLVHSLLEERLHSAARVHDVWLQHRGRRCRRRETLASANVQPGAFLKVNMRLRGGGGDGGATGAESRSSYLEMYMSKKPLKVNPTEEKLARWTTCKLSGEPLQPPCAVDELGSLYNKDAVVTALVTKSMPKSLAHISSLRHVSDVKLTPNAKASARATARASTAEDYQPGNDAAFCCPITGQELNGQYRFCVVQPSGHVLSEKAIKQVPAAVEELIGAKLAVSVVLPVNGSAEEVEALWDSLLAKRAAIKTKKDKKKAGKTVAAAGLASADGVTASAGMTTEHRSSSGSPSSDEPQSRNPVEKRAAEPAAEEKAKVKKYRAANSAPAHADKKLWASLFTSAHGTTKETYACRSTMARGMV